MTFSVLMVVFGTALVGTSSSLKPPEDVALRREARIHAEAGQRAFREARYTDAVTEFQKSRSLWRHPAITFNLGRCHEQMGELQEAVHWYREYVSESSNDDQKREVIAAIENLERHMPAAGSKVEAISIIQPLSPPRTAFRNAKIVSLSTTAVALITGATFGMVANSARSEMLSGVHPGLQTQLLHDRALVDSRYANVSYGVASVAILTSIILFTVDRH